MIKKIIRYRHLVFLVIILSAKYHFLLAVLKGDRFLRLINKIQPNIRKEKSLNRIQSKKELTRKIDIIIKKLNPKASCLIKSLIKKEILNREGYTEVVNLGLMRDGGLLRAHAWISNENNTKFNIVYQIQ